VGPPVLRIAVIDVQTQEIGGALPHRTSVECHHNGIAHAKFSIRDGSIFIGNAREFFGAERFFDEVEKLACVG
jgi:hypothetical protein